MTKPTEEPFIGVSGETTTAGNSEPTEEQIMRIKSLKVKDYNKDDNCVSDGNILEPTTPEIEKCHCGKDGHALNSVNCPIHGFKIEQKMEEKIERMIGLSCSGGELSQEFSKFVFEQILEAEALGYSIGFDDGENNEREYLKVKFNLDIKSFGKSKVTNDKEKE